VRVATFNIQHGRALSDGRVDVRRFADAVRTIDADVLALQEVDRAQSRSHGADLAVVAARAMGAVAHRFVPALIGAPGTWRSATGDEPADAPGYGIALLSRHPVRTWQVVRLPPLAVPLPLRFSGRRPRLVRDEPRVAVVAVVDVPGGPLTVAGTHLTYLSGWNSVQLRLLTRTLRRCCDPVVLLGDLNMHAAAAQRATSGMARLATGLTFPADRPRKQIDHVLGRGVATAGGGRTHALPLSDHRALSVDLTLSPSTGP
jgi:endonuclease/exonuclease/phosphatase family metal-dependent hydrolase